MFESPWSTFMNARRRPVCALFAAISVAFLAASPLKAEEATQERFEKKYDLAGIRKVRVQNVNGVIQIESGGDQLQVIAVKKVKSHSDSDLLKETEIRVTKNGSTIEVETMLPRRGWFFQWSFFGRSGSADVAYQITLPAPLALEAETVNGRVTAANRSGDLVLSTVNGGVRVDGHDGPLKVNTVNGSVEVSFAGPMRQASLETVNGSVTVTCARESSIRCTLQTTNGRIQSQFPEVTVEGKWGPKEARGAINGGRESLAVETVNGDVRLYVADAAPARK
jgi:Putative adhesin